MEQAHQRAKLRAIFKNKIKKGISLEEAIGHVMDNYSEIQVRTLIEGNDKRFHKQVVEDIGTHIRPVTFIFVFLVCVELVVCEEESLNGGNVCCCLCIETNDAKNGIIFRI